MTLSDEQIQDLLRAGNPTDEECRLIRMGWDAAMRERTAPSAPEGWKLVPIDPTLSMLTAAILSSHAINVHRAEHCYRAMIAASPEAPSVPDHKTIKDLLNKSGLCAYDREGDLAFMVAATKFAALAAAPEARP